MGLCCSCCCDSYCTKCGCPYHHYHNDKHASRRSCRGYINNLSGKTEYHNWSHKIF